MFRWKLRFDKRGFVGLAMKNSNYCPSYNPGKKMVKMLIQCSLGRAMKFACQSLVFCVAHAPQMRSWFIRLDRTWFFKASKSNRLILAGQVLEIMRGVRRSNWWGWPPLKNELLVKQRAIGPDHEDSPRPNERSWLLQNGADVTNNLAAFCPPI